MKVRDIQETFTLAINPALLRRRLTLWTMPIAARIVRGVFGFALGAELEMTTKLSGATLRNISEYALLLARDGVGCHQCVSMIARDFGKFKVRRPDSGAHALT
jgi:alkylhydroperoxidase family enzyme